MGFEQAERGMLLCLTANQHGWGNVPRLEMHKVEGSEAARLSRGEVSRVDRAGGVTLEMPSEEEQTAEPSHPSRDTQRRAHLTAGLPEQLPQHP